MEARNLHPEDCDKLEEVMSEIKQTNPQATHRFFPESNKVEPPPTAQFDRIEDKLDALNAKLDKIFGTAILINGRWVSI